MMSAHYKKTYFLLSVADVKQLPPDTGIEIAIVGRSNAGKSSVLNCITQNKSLARVSKTPGRTQLLNVFSIDPQRRLMDLPGYGYAKVHASVKEKWSQTIHRYLETRLSLKGLIVIMDIRHPFKPMDQLLLNYCHERSLPVHVLLNKADKLNKNDIKKTYQLMVNNLIPYPKTTLQIFSTLAKTGLKELFTTLDQWYQYTT